MNLQFRFSVLSNKCLLTLICFSVGGFVTSNVETLFAQGASELTAVYGRGVHAFFGCDATRAEQLFTEVITAGSQDPRVYYFRGLARLQQGRQYEAEEDFRMGAALEARDPGRRYAIGTALQRIQGPNRQTLERFRREGRLEKYQERREQNQLRYEHLRSRESDVLHQDAPVLMEDLVNPSVERPSLPGSDSGGTNGTKKMEPSVPATVPSTPATPAPQPKSVPSPTAPTVTPEEDIFGSSPTEKPAATEEDPFGAPAKAQPKSAPTTAEDDLFGDSAPTPAEPTPAKKEPAPAPVPAEEDLFSAPTPGPGEPAPAKAEPAPAEDLFSPEPAGESTPDDSSNPFGSEAEASPTPEPKPAEETKEGPKPAEPAPAPEPATDDPFGSTESADENMAEDPFGESEVSSPDTAFDEPTADERVLDNEVAHDEDAEAVADKEATDEAKDVGAFIEEPAGDEDPFGESMEDSPAEETSDEVPPADDTNGDADTSAEGAADESTSDDAEMTEDTSSEPSTEDEDPFGGF